MAHIVVLGAGIGGVPAAYELRDELGAEHQITVINPVSRFQFVPSNPWVAVGWRTRDDTTLDIRPPLERKGINFIPRAGARIEPEANKLELDGGEVVRYDYLVIATGPKLAFDEVEGAGPEDGFTASICTLEHAEKTYAAYQKLLAEPGQVIVGAMPSCSCFGPAYEFAFILDTDLRRRKMRDRVSITFVTSEPYIGHLGLGGIGDSKGYLESDMRARHMDWITNARTTRVADGRMHVDQYDGEGRLIREHALDFRLAMMLPAFRGADVVSQVEGLCDPRGLVIVDEHQRSPAYPNIFAAGEATALAPVEGTVVPTGAPKTGYMIESMVTAIVHNIADDIAGRRPSSSATMNAVCLADMGDTGMAFVAVPQKPPRSLAWFRKGKWVHMAKVAYEKYFIRKMKAGTSDPVYEKFLLRMVGLSKLKDAHPEAAETEGGGVGKRRPS